MARRFAVGDNIVCSVGACGPVGTGAYTLVWLYQIPLFSGIGGLGALRRSGAFAREGFVTTGKFYGAGDFDGFGTSPEAVWVWVAQRKVAGSAVYEWAYGVYPIADPDVDITFGSSGPGTHGDPGVGDQVYIGLTDVQGNPTRDIAVQAFFTGRLSDATIKGIFTTALADLIAAGPVGCWPLNQGVTTDPVVDVTGNGADQTLLTGTTVVANPPGYDFNLTPPVIDGSATVDLGALTIGAIGQKTVYGAATVGLDGLNVSATGQRTAVGLAVVNLGQLTISASAITGGPVILADDFYSPGPCRPYEYVSFCEIPLAAAAITGYAIGAASEILYYATGQRFDTCQVTIRPCRKECSGEDWPRLSAGWWEFGGGPVPALINGLWYNIACGFCGTNCSCSIVSETILPGPVREIVQVTVDGLPLDPVTDYRLDDYRKLVRLGGNLWPLCNDLNKGITEVGTWSVTAIYGEPLPNLGRFAMGELYCQIIQDTLGSDCALPDNVTNITRQGLSFTLEDVQQMVASGFDELKYVNKFIQRYNPNHLMARPRLYDVDAPDFRVTGTVIS